MQTTAGQQLQQTPVETRGPATFDDRAWQLAVVVTVVAAAVVAVGMMMVVGVAVVEDIAGIA